MLTVEQLIALIAEPIYAAHIALDNSEVTETGESLIAADDGKALCDALDALDVLPDKPGYVCGPAAKVQYALRQALAPPLSAERAELVSLYARHSGPMGKGMDYGQFKAAIIEAWGATKTEDMPGLRSPLYDVINKLRSHD